LTLLEQLIRGKLAHHPLPWRVDYDWTVELYDSNGGLVIKLQTADQAQELIGLAEAYRAEDELFSAEFERMINESEV
jgi:hypothetical protein